MKIYRVIDKNTGIFIRDDFTFDENTEIGLDVEASQGLVLPKWQDGKWVECGIKPLPVLPELTLEEKVDKLVEELSATDYKIIKCYEYQLIGQELPYDVQALHNERQILRDQINSLEVL